MKEKTGNVMRGGVRATTGILIIGVAATAVVLLGNAPLPGIERQPVSVTADTLQGAARNLVCAGSFAVLGADPTRPSVALPTGDVAITMAGALESQSELVRAEPGGTAPQVLGVPAGETFGAVQTQEVFTDTLRGRTASTCLEASNEQWLVGGSTTLGTTATVSLGNPSAVPATVQLTVYDENGQVDSAQTSGVLVPAGSERVVSLNGYAPGREQLAVRVVSTGAAVTASLGVAQVADLTPFAVDTVTRQLSPSRTLTVPGVANASDHQHGPGDAGELDPYSVLVRVLAPGGESGTATVRAVMPDGTSEQLGTIEYSGRAVAEFPVAHWPEEAEAAIIDAADPIVGAVMGSVDTGVEHDYAWFVPASPLTGNTDIAVAVAGGGELVLVNPGDVDAEVRVSDDGGVGGAKRITVPAGGAVTASASGAAVLNSTEPIVAGVRILRGGDIAGYPLSELNERAGSLTVFTR